MSEKAIEALPCPFCGSPPQWVKEATPGCAVSAFLACTDADCFGTRTTAVGPDAIAQWNKRAAPPPLRARKEIARAIARGMYDCLSVSQDHFATVLLRRDILPAVQGEGRVPEGWQLVPKEPTHTMCPREQDENGYRLALKHAPSAPPAPAPEGEWREIETFAREYLDAAPSLPQTAEVRLLTIKATKISRSRTRC